MILFSEKGILWQNIPSLFFFWDNFVQKTELLYGMLIIRQNLIDEWIPIHELFLNHKIKNLARPTNKASFWRKDFLHVNLL
jgi:hypothetical protein